LEIDVKQLLFAMLLLMPGIAFATDYHVLIDSDGDGNANPCTNAAHDNHYTTDTTTCGDMFDIDNDGAPERLYCNLQSALNAAMTCGDTVEIHAGTWDNNDTTPTIIADFCTATESKVLMLVKTVAGCDTEGERRYVRGAFMASSQDIPIVTLTGDTDVKSAMSIGLADTDNVQYVQVDHIYFEDAVSDVGCLDNLSYWLPMVYLRGRTDFLRITQNTFVGDPGTDVGGDGFTLMAPDECPNPATPSEDGMVAISGDGQSQRYVDSVEIDNNTVDMCGFLSYKNNASGDCCLCYINDWHIHDNNITIEDYRAGGTSFHGEVQHTCDWVFNDNIFYTKYGEESSSAFGPSWKWRRGAGSWWIFNNYFQETHGFAQSQSSCENSLTTSPNYYDGRIYVFNNTSNDTEGGPGFISEETGTDASCPGWPVGQEIWSFSNSWEMAVSGVWDDLLTSTGQDKTGYDHFTSGSYTLGTAQQTDSGHYACTDIQACGANTLWTECSGSGGCNAAAPGRALSGSAPWPLLSGSILIAAGTNNPIGQGANVCSLTMWSGHVVDCSVDYNGDDRGGTWDIGADEFGLSTCGNDIREGTELCDDTNGDGADFGSDSCQARGFDGGFLTCTNCTVISTENCTTSVSSHSLLQGVTLRGGTIK
jgi:hypothetical protein